MPNKELVLVGEEVELARVSAQYMANALMDNIRYQLNNGAIDIYPECLKYIKAYEYVVCLDEKLKVNHAIRSDNTTPDSHG